MEAGNEGVRLSLHLEKALKFGRHTPSGPLNVYDLLKGYNYLFLCKLFHSGLKVLINSCCLLWLNSF